MVFIFFLQIVKVLEFIGKKEGLQPPPGFAARIAEKSNRSLRRAILSFETCRVQQLSTKACLTDIYRKCIHLASYACLLCSSFDCRYPFTSNQAIPPMDWEEYVSEIASDIMREQSPKKSGP